ncbi:MAG: lipoyl(octanoyl) transferase LipB [Kangiellaceae bacterium]|jgi:lipoyl(octanoyl) transferase|nr:lipoyl(octanoyl) transferase LipB [Kangiellaceae bacterium]
MDIIIRQLDSLPYQPVWYAMSEFTNQRDDQTTDELWLVQHDPVFTQGQAGKAEHVLAPGDIPVVQVDRGGQVTYHGPGQQVIYFLINLKRKKLGVRDLVTSIEESVIDLLDDLGIKSHARADAPGVYLESGAKICALGLRIRRGCSFHGLALNIKLDLEPFSRINPCGYKGMAVTQVSDHYPVESIGSITDQLVAHLLANLGYNNQSLQSGLPASL